MEAINKPDQSDSNSDSISKNQLSREKKKMKKKVAQAIAVIVKAEQKTYDELVSKIPTKQLFVTHFGNGDEEDQNVIYEYVKSFGPVQRISIFPGTNYGHLEFINEEIPASIMNDLDGENVKTLKFFGKDRLIVFFYTPISYQDLRKNSQIDVPNAFVAKTGLIPGLQVFENFISEEEEQKLIKDIDNQQWIKLLNRRVQHYGYEFVYGSNNVDKNKKIGELPDFCQFMNEKFEKILNSFTEINGEILDKKLEQKPYFSQYGHFDQLTINDYMPGQGIPPHVDTHSPFQQIFCSLSLKSGVSMHFRTPEHKQMDIYLQPRSLLLFSGESRYYWLHSIALRKIDKCDGLLKFRHRRISLTFRKVKIDPCTCKFKKLCDSQNKEVAVEQNMLTGESEEAKIDPTYSQQVTATDMEKKHVYEVYDKIAPHFSNTRYKAWPKIQKYLENLEEGSLNIDVGCGNGKYLGVNSSKIFNIGTDRSGNLLTCCREKDNQFQTFVCDSLRIPVRNNMFDSAISIAVVHHFSTINLRIQAIKELTRILKVGGKLLIYVWAYEQEGKVFQTQDVFVPWHLQDKYEEEEKSTQENQEEEKKESVRSSQFIDTAIKDEQKKATVYHRYYHVFKEGELENLIEDNFKEILVIKDRYYDHANWAVLCEKLQ